MYPSNSDSVAQDQLQSFFQRWQRLEEEKHSIGEDLKELFAEAKGFGFDTKVMRKVFRDKTADAAERAEFETMYDIYWNALGTNYANARHARDSSPEPNVPPASGVPVTEAAEQPVREATSLTKASTGNAVNATTQGSERAEPQDWNGDDGSGEASRPSEGGGSPRTISQADPDKSAEVETSAAPVAPGKRRWNFTDKAHPDCLNPEQCGGFSNHGLCERCKAAA